MTAELKAMKSRMNKVEERISDLEDRIMEITQSTHQTANEKKNERNKTDLWNSLKCANICLTWITEGEERQKGTENILKNYG